jgi:hypothetical protein
VRRKWKIAAATSLRQRSIAAVAGNAATFASSDSSDLSKDLLLMERESYITLGVWRPCTACGTVIVLVFANLAWYF